MSPGLGLEFGSHVFGRSPAGLRTVAAGRFQNLRSQFLEDRVREDSGKGYAASANRLHPTPLL
jgi:hypothetical protein